MTSDMKTVTTTSVNTYTAQVIFDTVFGVGENPFIGYDPRTYNIKGATDTEALTHMENNYDNRANSSWTAWIVYREQRITIVEEDTDDRGYARMTTAVKTTREVVAQRLRSEENYNGHVAAREAQAKYERESGITAAYEARDAESAENRERYSKGIPMRMEADIAYRKITGSNTEDIEREYAEYLDNFKAKKTRKMFGWFR